LLLPRREGSPIVHLQGQTRSRGKRKRGRRKAVKIAVARKEKSVFFIKKISAIQRGKGEREEVMSTTLKKSMRKRNLRGRLITREKGASPSPYQ